jgi:cytochrome c oxidase subunit 2
MKALQRLFAMMFVSLSIPAAAEDFDYCILCHGTNGNGNSAIRAPKISGMELWYIARQLEAFATGMRGAHPDDTAGQEMQPVGARLKSESTLAAATQFITSLPSGKVEKTISGDVQRGRALYAACAGCHGAKAEGNEALQAPALASRSDWYLVAQLEKYRRGLRGTDSRDIYGAQMRAAATELGEEQASTDVVAFINTLQ